MATHQITWSVDLGGDLRAHRYSPGEPCFIRCSAQSEGWFRTAAVAGLRTGVGMYFESSFWAANTSPQVFSNAEVWLYLGTGSSQVLVHALSLGVWQFSVEFDTVTRAVSWQVTDPDGNVYSGNTSFTYSYGTAPPFTEYGFDAGFSQGTLSPPPTVPRRARDSVECAEWTQTVDTVTFLTDGVHVQEETFDDENFALRWPVVATFETGAFSTWECTGGGLREHVDADPVHGTAILRGPWVDLWSGAPVPAAPNGLVSLARLPVGKVLCARIPSGLFTGQDWATREEVLADWTKTHTHPVRVSVLDGAALVKRWESPSLVPFQGRSYCAGVYHEAGQACVGELFDGSLAVVGSGGSGYSYVCAALRPGGGGFDLLCLDAPAAGPYTWKQHVATWDEEAETVTFTAVHAGPAAGLNMVGSLRRAEDGGLWFAFLDTAYDAKLYRCPGLAASDAHSAWTSWGTIAAGTYAAVAICPTNPPGGMVAMLLDNSGANPIWKSMFGKLNRAGTAIAWSAVRTATNIANSALEGGSLVQLPDGSWLFAMVDAAASDTKYYHCPAVRVDGTSTWTEKAP